MSKKPHILFVSTFYPKEDLLQYCQFVHEEAKALIRRGYMITVINPRSDIKRPRTWSLEGIPILCLPYRTWRTNYSYIINSYFLYHSLKVLGRDYFLQFDFIHVHNCLPEGNALLLLKRNFRLDIPMTVQIHDLNVEKCGYIRLKAAQYLFRKRCRSIYHAYDFCIGVSEPVSDLIRSTLPDTEKAKVITALNGYNPDIFHKTPMVDDASNSFPIRILFVGNLIELKGIRNLIHAYCQCYPEFSVPTELWILGCGILEKEMQALVREYQMENHVSFKGYVSTLQVADYMNQCHIYAVPSTYEGFGCVYLEAMACGLPCIACTGQGISGILELHEVGLLIPPHNLEKLKESLLKLVNHPEIRHEYALRISQMIPNYTWDSAVEPITQIYEASFTR